MPMNNISSFFKTILTIFIAFNCSSINAQSILSLLPNYGYRGIANSSLIITDQLLTTTSSISDVYLYGPSNITIDSISFLHTDTAEINFTLQLNCTAGLYNFHIKVDGVDYNCLNCFTIEPPAGTIDGYAFMDLNQDGSPQSEEPPKPWAHTGLYSGSTLLQGFSAVNNGWFQSFVIFSACYNASYCPDSIFSPTNSVFFCINSGVWIGPVALGLYGTPIGIDSISPNSITAGDTLFGGIIYADSIFTSGLNSYGNINNATLYGPSEISIKLQDLNILAPNLCQFSLPTTLATDTGSYSLMICASDTFYSCQNCFQIRSPLNTSIDPINDTKSDISIYPNPSNGNFELSFSELSEKTDIILSDGFGKIIHESKNINSTKLNFAILGESGCYFLKIITNDKINVFKIIKI
jgi:hypothetical protein